MDKITQARHNFVLAFQYCWNGKEFPIFREISVSELERIHTGYCAIDLLDEALKLKPDFQEARDLRGDIWHAILANSAQDEYEKNTLNQKRGLKHVRNSLNRWVSCVFVGVLLHKCITRLTIILVRKIF